MDEKIVKLRDKDYGTYTIKLKSMKGEKEGEYEKVLDIYVGWRGPGYSGHRSVDIPLELLAKALGKMGMVILEEVKEVE